MCKEKKFKHITDKALLILNTSNDWLSSPNTICTANNCQIRDVATLVISDIVTSNYCLPCMLCVWAHQETTLIAAAVVRSRQHTEAFIKYLNWNHYFCPKDWQKRTGGKNSGTATTLDC